MRGREASLSADVRWRITPPMRLAICVCGINFFYLYYGVLQEQLYRADEDGSRFSATFFLMFLQCLVNFLVALAMMKLLGGEATAKPLDETATSSPFRFGHSGYLWVAAISLAYLLAMSASNQALMFVSYAFQALAKSCKMIPVMLGNVVLGSKRYSLKEYLVVFLITAGIVLFNLSAETNSDAEEDTESSSSGIILLVIALVLDGFTASNQRLFSNEFKPTTHALMMQMNLWSLLFLIPILLYTDQGQQGLNYLLQHPSWHFNAWMFALCSAMGQNFIFYTISGPGVLVCATITTTRKFFTILVSVMLYPENSLNLSQWVSVVIVFAGLFLELHDKYTKT